MKQQVTLALSLTLAAGLLAGCADTTGGSQPTGAAQTSPVDATPSAAQSAAFTDEMKIPHAVDLSPEDGADSVERLGDHADSPYFAHPDYYHMQSSDTLTILTGFQTVTGIFFQSIGKPVKAAVVTLSRQILVLVPATLLLPLALGLDGVLWAGPVADAISFLIGLVLALLELKHLTSQHAREQEAALCAEQGHAF